MSFFNGGSPTSTAERRSLGVEGNTIVTYHTKGLGQPVRLSPLSSEESGIQWVCDDGEGVVDYYKQVVAQTDNA
jgi:hypothetical protein